MFTAMLADRLRSLAPHPMQRWQWVNGSRVSTG